MAKKKRKGAPLLCYALGFGALYILYMYMTLAFGQRGAGVDGDAGGSAALVERAAAMEKKLSELEKTVMANQKLIKESNDKEKTLQSGLASLKAELQNVRISHQQAISIAQARGAAAKSAPKPVAAVSPATPRATPAATVAAATKVKAAATKTVVATQPNAATAGDGIFMVVGIPTVPRKGDTDYINPALNTIARDLPTNKAHALYGKVSHFIITI